MPNKPLKQPLLSFTPKHQQQAVTSIDDLHLAAAEGNIARMQQLVSRHNFDVNALHTGENIPPIAFAARAGQLNAMKWLTAEGAIIDYDLSLYPFCFSVWYYVIFYSKQLDIIIWLEQATHTHLAAHINRCPTHGEHRNTTIFWTAIFNHDWAAVNNMLLWEADEDANIYPEATHPGESGLWLIAKALHFDLFKQLLKRKSRVNPNAISYTSGISIPLILAFYRQHELLWEIEHDYGIADINATSTLPTFLPGATITWHLVNQNEFGLAGKLISRYKELNIRATPLTGPDQYITIFELLLIKKQYEIAECAFQKDSFAVAVIRKKQLETFLLNAIKDQQLWLVEGILNQNPQFNLTNVIVLNDEYNQLLQSYIKMTFKSLTERRWKMLMQACLRCELVDTNQLNQHSRLLLACALTCNHVEIQQAAIWILFLALIAYSTRYDLTTMEQLEHGLTSIGQLDDAGKTLLTQHKITFIEAAQAFKVVNQVNQREEARNYLLTKNPMLSPITHTLLRGYYALACELNEEEEQERLLLPTNTSSLFFHSTNRKQREANFKGPAFKFQAISSPITPLSAHSQKRSPTS